MNPFEHVEIIQHSKPNRVYNPCLKLTVDIKNIPKFDTDIAKIAWLKYILDNYKITKVSRLCNRCRRTLLDSEEYCSNCDSKSIRISKAKCIDILITNTRQILEIPISIQNMGRNYYTLINRFVLLFPGEYLNIFAANGKNIVTYPSFTDFPDVEDVETIDLLGTIFLDESTGDTYILDFGDIYEHPSEFYSTSALYNTELVADNFYRGELNDYYDIHDDILNKYSIAYIKVNQNNIKYILERFIFWDNEIWQNKE